MSEVSLSVIHVSQPMGDFFIGTINAKALVEISFADVRRIEDRDVEKYLGIQRPLDKSRVKIIKDYLLSPDATFPTGVVLAVDQKCAEYDPIAGKLILKPYTGELAEDSVEYDKIAKVLDGQHRIAAFHNNEGNYDLQYCTDEGLLGFEFNVVIFTGLDIDEQANIFATVNLAQTKVNKSLVYDLEGLSKSQSPFRTCHFIAVALDSADESSPLYNRIKRLGVKTKGRLNAEPLTQAGFVEALIKLISPKPFADRVEFLKGKKPSLAEYDELKKYPFRNLFLNGKDNDIAVIIYNYFMAVQKKWPVAWADTNREGNLLPRSNAFKALMRFLRNAYVDIVGPEIGKIPTVDDFATQFEDLNVSDEDFTSGNFKPGSGGESAFYRLLMHDVTIQQLKN